MTPDEIAALRQKAEAAPKESWEATCIDRFEEDGEWYWLVDATGPAGPLRILVLTDAFDYEQATQHEASRTIAKHVAAFNPAVALALLDDLDTTRALANRVHTDAAESAASNVADEQEDEKELEELRAQVTRLEQERDEAIRKQHDDGTCLPHYRIIELLAEHDIDETDTLKHVLEDWARWKQEIFGLSIAAERTEAAEALLRRLKRGSCWCEVGIGDPMYSDHSMVCKAVRKFLAPPPPWT